MGHRRTCTCERQSEALLRQQRSARQTILPTATTRISGQNTNTGPWGRQ